MSTLFYVMDINRVNTDRVAVRIEGMDSVDPLFTSENKRLIVPLVNETLGRSDVHSLGGCGCERGANGHPEVVVPRDLAAQFKATAETKYGSMLWEAPLIQTEPRMTADTVWEDIGPEGAELGMRRHEPPRELPDGGLVYAGWTYRRPVKQVTAVTDHDHSKCRVQEEKNGQLWFCAALYQRWTDDGWADQHVWEISENENE